MKILAGIPEQRIPGYAPASDGNDTEGYAQEVADYLGVAPDTQIDVYMQLPSLTAAMMTRETGYSEDINLITTWVYEA